MTEKSTWELIAERADYSSLGAGDKEMEELATLHIPRAHMVLNGALNRYTWLANRWLRNAFWLYRKGYWDDNHIHNAAIYHEGTKWAVEAVRRLYGVTEDVIEALPKLSEVAEFDDLPEDWSAIPEDRRDDPDEKSDRQKWDEIGELLERQNDYAADPDEADANRVLDQIRDILDITDNP